MSLDLKSPAPGNGAVYSDLLLQLEENPTPETLQRLHLKIDQLEEKLYDQARLAHCKELEIYNKYDEKRGQITFKYLQIKAELASFKALYKEKENLWQRDSSNLLKIVKCLFSTLSQSEEKTKEFLRDIEGELGKEIWQKGIDIANGNVYDSKTKSKRSSSQDGRQTGNEVPKNGIFQTPKQSSGLGFSRELSPEPFNTCKKLFPQIFVTPTVEVQSDYSRENTEIISPSVILNGAPDLNIPQPFSKAPTSSILSIQRKIRDYITELTEHSASQRLKMDREINDILRRVTTFNENLNSENRSNLPVGFSHEKIQTNFLKPPRSSNNKNTLFTPFNKNKSHRQPSYSISTNLINELEAQAPPSMLGNFSTEQKYQKESFRTVKKFQDTDHPNTQNDVIRKLDELQNSLALSEKEALLFMMMDNLENNRSRIDVNLDDLLKIPNNKSHSKVSGNSMSSFYHDGSSAIKDVGDQSNGSVSIEDPSPRFPIEKSPELNQFTIFTPIAKKKEGMNRPTSPHLAAEIDMYLQNVDLGSFVCHNEEESRHEGVNTPDLNDALSRDGISPILARQKKICQEIPQNYNFPTSVEKEYGRRLGGMLDFDDEHIDHIDNFESQFFKEEESASTNDYGRLPTAEGTESGGKGRKRVDSQQEQSGSESNERTKEFNFQTFSAKKV